jgi:hypothetical protein
LYHRSHTLTNTEFDLDEDDGVNENTVRSRTKRNNPDGRKTTVMVEAEKALIPIALSAIEMGEPLDRATFLGLANSMIEGTETQELVKNWQSVHKKEPTGVLSAQYYTLFMNRHKHTLNTTVGQKRDINRQQWGTFTNISLMYDEIYKLLERHGIAEKMLIPQPQTIDGVETVADSDEQCGLPVEYRLLHPERLLHMDETGCNTNQKSDGRVGGKTYIGKRGGGKVQIISATTDKRFTLLPIMNSIGHAVCCVIIFQGESTDKIPNNWVTGIDIQATDKVNAAADDDFLAFNSGAGKMFPGGPTCFVDGKCIPTYPTISVSGGVTSQILADVLEYLDELNVFPRGDGLPDPFIILDGHNSRFGVPFLQYIVVTGIGRYKNEAIRYVQYYHCN